MNVDDFAYIVGTDKSFDDAVVSVLRAVEQNFPEVSKEEAEEVEKDIKEIVDNAR